MQWQDGKVFTSNVYSTARRVYDSRTNADVKPRYVHSSLEELVVKKLLLLSGKPEFIEL